MTKAKYEEKFTVINHKHLIKVPPKIKNQFFMILGIVESYIPKNNYYVCNQDEPYAEKVLNTILDGEDAKKNKILGEQNDE